MGTALVLSVDLPSICCRLIKVISQNNCPLILNLNAKTCCINFRKWGVYFWPWQMRMTTPRRLFLSSSDAQTRAPSWETRPAVVLPVKAPWMKQSAFYGSTVSKISPIVSDFTAPIWPPALKINCLAKCSRFYWCNKPLALSETAGTVPQWEPWNKHCIFRFLYCRKGRDFPKL